MTNESFTYIFVIFSVADSCFNWVEFFVKLVKSFQFEGGRKDKIKVFYPQ